MRRDLQLANPRQMVIAVTGASGFIGQRLLQMLAVQPDIAAMRPLSRRGGEGVATRLDSLADLRTALAGCDALVHCAFDLFDMAANLRIARTVAEACSAVGARLIHVSTAAVHEPLPDGDLNETHVALPTGDAYKDTKLAIEQELQHCVAQYGLKLLILRPTVVYGPFGGAWTDGPVRELLSGRVVLPDDGQGLCNAVFVDDVCAAIIDALRSDPPSGEVCLVSGPAPVEWRTFLGAYQDMLGRDALCFQPLAELLPAVPAAPASGAKARIRSLLHTMLPLGAARRLLARGLGTRGRLRLLLLLQRFRRLGGSRNHVPTGARLALYASHCHVRTDHARALIGYLPQFDLARGMAATAPYVQRLAGIRPLQ
jgi:nucleoside-diphosphate-sugar epimerase